MRVSSRPRPRSRGFAILLALVLAPSCGPATLPDQPVVYSERPSWSPDGTRIVFDSNRDGDDEIYVMDADGSNVTQLTDNEAGDYTPFWSPDGSLIAYDSQRDGNVEVYLMQPDGSGTHRLTDSPDIDNLPSFFPDGAAILFQSTRDGQWEVYRMNPDGTGQQNLSNAPADDEYSFVSPDGSKICFHSNRTGTWEIFVMDADGSNQVQLTGREVAASLPREPGYWLALKDAGFTLPDGARAGDLLVEMNPLLASPNPVLRDEVVYSAAVQWMLRDAVLSPDEIRRVMNLWLANLDDGLGEPEGAAVLKRSFSALCLSIVAAADLQSPFLTQPEFDRFLGRTLDYFSAERDLRGFDAEVGWMHSVAHTSDVLKFLARNPKLPVAAQAQLLDAFGAKLTSADAVFTWGEPDRMAAAIRSLVVRSDFDRGAFDRWLAPWPERHRALWAGGPNIDPGAFARVENGKAVLRSLHATLAMASAPTPEVVSTATAVLSALAEMR